MSLERGTRLGPYEIESVLGAGGMGEVYRARDTRLKRDVAIKVLPAEFARDPDRIARLQREAEVLATLNHPNVGAVYGFEETPDAAGIVMELVEGPTLGDRIAHGPIPIDEALTMARQIADALKGSDSATVCFFAPDGRSIGIVTNTGVIFYRNGDKMMAVDLTTTPEVNLSAPRVLFEQRYAFGAGITMANYDVTRDGQRFIMVKDESGAARLNVILNWLSELTRMAPAR